MKTVYILKPLTKDAWEWVNEKLDPSAMQFGGGIAIEWRYVDDIMMGIEVDGLTDQFKLIS